MVSATFLCGSGEGLSPSVQALALDAITKVDNAALFAFLGVIDTLGKLIGGPVMAFLFSIRDAGGHSIGYCFALSAVSSPTGSSMDPPNDTFKVIVWYPLGSQWLLAEKQRGLITV